MRRFASASLVALVLWASTASAILVDRGVYTTDAATGLDWLDLTESRGLSYDTVSDRMDPGERFAGWRFATRAEVHQFWASAGGTGPFTGLANGQTNWVGRLQELWGRTYPFVYTVSGFTVQGTIAMTSDVSPTCPACNLTVYLLDAIDVADSSLGDYAEGLQMNEAYRWDGQAPIGHALVRVSDAFVSEPASAALIGMLLLLGGVFRKKRASVPPSDPTSAEQALDAPAALPVR